MIDKKYNKVLTVVLIIVVVVIFALLGFWGYDTIKRYFQEQDKDVALNEFNNSIIIGGGSGTVPDNSVNGNGNYTIVGNEVSNSGTGSSNRVVTYKGFTVMGKIEIPAIELEYPVLERATKLSLEQSVGIMTGPGLNKVGNTVIAGHNYRNGTFFSRNKDLKEEDLIYITDTDGNRVKYTIYNIYYTSREHADYIRRDTAGKREITLTPCTDDSKNRLIIWAKEDN